MATIEKLVISGIRSFGDDESGRQLIRFDKPVTLILGENGCGKSTIIECLRFATTQKEPFGKSVFVRDPDLCYHQTVKASVKLMFLNGAGDEIHVSRGLQATRIRKGITQKTLDSTIVIKKPGEKPVQISSRCADTAAETLRHMGTSKAILDSVVFCSQEDAFWPLDTDKTLKEKFDQIFDSEKYNKCLMRVKDLHKKLKQKKAQLEQDVEYHREKKTAALAKRNQVNNIHRDIDGLKNELINLDEELKPIEERLQEIDKQERELSRVYTTRETTKTELTRVEKEKCDLKKRLQGSEYAGTDDQLESALSELNAKGKNTNELKEELQYLKNEEQKLGSAIGQCMSRMGQLTKAVEINKAKVAERDGKIKDIAAQCCVEPVQDEISSYINNKKKDLIVLQKEQEMTEDKCQQNANKARDAVVCKNSEINRFEKSLLDNNQEINDIRNDLASVGQSQRRREMLSSQLRQSEIELEDHQKSLDATAVTLELQRVQNQLKTAENKLKDAETEVRKLQSHSANGHQLEYNKTELAKKDADVRRLINNHRDTFTDILGVTVPQSNFKRTVEQLADKFSTEAKDLRNQKANREGAKIALVSNVSNIRSLLQKKKLELQTFQNQVYDVTKGVDLNDSLALTKNKVDSLQEQKGEFEAATHMFNSYISRLKDKPCCPLCRRDFAAEEEAKQLADSLKKKVELVPSKLESVRQDLNEKQDHLRKLHDLESLQKKMDSLHLEEVPALEKEEAEKKAQVTQAMKDIDVLEQKLERAEKNRTLCINMFGDMALIDQAYKAIDSLKTNIQKIEPLLPADWNKDSLRVAEERRDVLASAERSVELERNEIQHKLTQYNEKLAVLQSKKHQLAEEELSLRSKDGQQKVQEERLAILHKSQLSLQSELEAARLEVITLNEIHREKDEELRVLKENNKKNFRAEQNKLDRIISQFRDVERLHREVNEFSCRGDEEKLQELQADIASRENSLRATKMKIENVSSKLGDLAEIEVRRHGLEDNKSLRAKSREIDLLKKKLTDLEASIGRIGIDSLLREKRRCKIKVEEIGQRKAKIGGEMGALDGQKTSIENELDSTMYKNIDLRFMESLVTQKIAEAQTMDLHRYAVAMDHAMGVYHKQAMERVNAYIHEYWAKIYRGNDIDTIEIQAEQAQTCEIRRTFNYKLVQKKGDTAIDMRNRCSAGQKMLACLIVRMSLAEVFSSNCGILTLDEPTTNLDKKNISMLAEALNELIMTKSRLDKTNFQLIIITHDKDFLRQITSYQGVERYIQVSRSPDGTSLITTRKVNESS